MHLAIIGCGPSAIYLLKHLADLAEVEDLSTWRISIFEKSHQAGVGMPWSKSMVEKCHLANITSEKLPPLPETLVDWMRSLDTEFLSEFGIEPDSIDTAKIYPRLVIGGYFRAQYLNLLKRLRGYGLSVTEDLGQAVCDLREEQGFTVILSDGRRISCDKAVIASGHHWQSDDQPEHGYYGCPWPIGKLSPAAEALDNFPVGILGASLSAYDVLISLALKHGKFYGSEGKMSYCPADGTEKFKVVLHSAEGWLPRMEFQQQKTFRKPFREVDQAELEVMIEADGVLDLDQYFDNFCRSSLMQAARKDGLEELEEALGRREFILEDFIEMMSEPHDYADPFKGLKREMETALKDIRKDEPTHWKEVLDDMCYCLNFYASDLSYSDFERLTTALMPLMLNVVAGFPLASAHRLLALYDAGKVELRTGKVTVRTSEREGTAVLDESGEVEDCFVKFVDCTGQGSVDLKKFPFPSLVEQGLVRPARSKGESPQEIGGVEIDRFYRLVDRNGDISHNLYDIAFPHLMGCRPYSYGLQSCSDAAKLVVASWSSTSTDA